MPHSASRFSSATLRPIPYSYSAAWSFTTCVTNCTTGEEGGMKYGRAVGVGRGRSVTVTNTFS